MNREKDVLTGLSGSEQQWGQLACHTEVTPDPEVKVVATPSPIPHLASSSLD